MKKLLHISIIILLSTISIHTNAITPYDTVKYTSELKSYFQKVLEDQHLTGMSVAIFSNNGIILKDCYGKSSYKTPINDSTLFSIQSMSKNFTAMAVLFAVQDGLVNLDTPIIRYLPDFKINSCYEARPEEKITLRMLLSHTAGFTHHASIGNNFDYTCNSKQEHWNSISDTWLKFPVGTRYSYSNLGFDLATKIIENVSGSDFETYLKEKIFVPLGMMNTFINDSEIVDHKNKTEGSIPYLRNKHYDISSTFIGSGAIYSCINDMIKYVQFQLNFGNINGSQLLKKEYIEEMYTINKHTYGLGIEILNLRDFNEQLDSYSLSHTGGGVGYGSAMAWLPEYNIGFVILGNNPIGYADLVRKPFFDFLNNVGFKKQYELTKGFEPAFKSDEYYEQALEFIPRPKVNDYTFDKEKIVGKYEILDNVKNLKWYLKILRFFGIKKNLKSINVTMIQDAPVMEGYFGQYELKEYLPGLFFTTNGEAFDFRNKIPTYMNIKLRKYSNR